MFNGENLQYQHRTGAALQARLRMVAVGQAIWTDYHQIGVLYASLANSTWLIGGGDWRAEACGLMRKAESHLAEARKRLPPGDDLADISLLTDEALWSARMERLALGNNYVHAARTGLEKAASRLNTYTRTGPTECPNAWHQLGIVCSLQSQVAWGSPFGFGTESNRTLAESFADKANVTFYQERQQSPDGERAYRAFLIEQALVYGLVGRRRERWQLGWLAAASAQHHRDRPHLLRALTVMCSGKFGERQLRILRDRHAITVMS